MARLFYGWVITAAAFVVLFLTYGVQYSFGVFVPAMVQDLGWQRSVIAGAFSLYTIVYTSFSVVSGRLTDSLGPRWVVGLGGLLLGTGIIATHWISSPWQLYFWYGIVAALGMSAAYIPCNITVVRWFQRSRGFALGVASSGASCGILAVPPLTALILARTDWRTALLMLGLFLMVLLILVARVMVRSPETIGLQPDGDDAQSTGTAFHGSTAAPDWTLSEAAGTGTFWLFVAAFAVTFITLTVPFVHLPSFAADLGLPAALGATSVGIVGLFSLTGSLVLGAISDRAGRKTAILLGLSLQIVAFALFWAADTLTILYVGAAAFGFFYGGIASLFPALVGDLFGRKHAGTMAGVIFGGAGTLGAWGPAAAGYFRDGDGDYRFAFAACAISAVFALLLFAILPRRVCRT